MIPDSNFMNKHLGQHFLINKSAISKIVTALDLQKGDIFIEIGPGKGALTLSLAENFQFLIPNSQIIAIEKDKKLAKELKKRIQNLKLKNIEIIEGDALKILPSIITNYHKIRTITNYKIVGNIPYYITGKLLRLLGELITNQSYEAKPRKIENIVLMLQKEVAERIAAKPPKMNLLAAAVQFWAEPKILFTLKPKDFSPAPKVNSAVIKLTPKPMTYDLRPMTYYKFIRTLFKQPRKTILNNLRTYEVLRLEIIKDKLKKLGINPQSRPQNLSIEQIIHLLI
jgi:16S rRNA (adenine1518-N6/adenine1519-N6)-dimethyltransferase